LKAIVDLAAHRSGQTRRPAPAELRGATSITLQGHWPEPSQAAQRMPRRSQAPSSRAATAALQPSPPQTARRTRLHLADGGTAAPGHRPLTPLRSESPSPSTSHRSPAPSGTSPGPPAAPATRGASAGRHRATRSAGPSPFQLRDPYRVNKHAINTRNWKDPKRKASAHRCRIPARGTTGPANGFLHWLQANTKENKIQANTWQHQNGITSWLPGTYGSRTLQRQNLPLRLQTQDNEAICL